MLTNNLFKSFFIVFALFIISFKQAFCQARLILNNGAFININNGAFLVIDNSASNAITRNTTGHIISEGENNRVAWAIRTNSGSYTVPFGYSTSDYIPLTFNISSAGVGAGNFIFSTYRSPSWDNNANKPTGVSHMYQNGTLSNNSAKVIDRFYQIDATTATYTTKPVINSVLLSYADAEHSVASNSITEANLGAQYFTSGSGWLPNFGIGTANTLNNNVTASSNLPLLNSTKWWTLVDKSSPLPITLSYFRILCETNKTIFDFQTTSERNTHFFEIKVIENGELNTIASIAAQGNSNQVKNYDYLFQGIFSNESLFYLDEIDLDGESHQYGPFQYQSFCNETNDEGFSNVVVFPNPAREEINVNFTNLTQGDLEIVLTNAIGQTVFHKKFENLMTESTIKIPIENLSRGIYFLNINNNKKSQKSFKISLAEP
jgi:hypothetical protein